jgi:hypothetical protein
MKVLRGLLLLALLPLGTGALVVTYQDASLTHWPGKATTQAQLREGTFPFLHPGASLGQPLAGNPNFGVFFPDTLLLFVLPLPVAFGLRFALPFLLGYAGARRWARAEGVTRKGAEVAAVVFALSPVFVSTWRFYNSGLALGIAPWVLAAVTKLVRTGDPVLRRRRVAEAGLWGGLELLAGEPVIALLTALLAGLRVLMALRDERDGLAARVAWVGGAGLVALLLAAPQIAATAQILPDSSRVKTPFPFVTATGTSTHPFRLVEQVVPFPYGRPDLRGPLGFDGHEVFDHHLPYLWTLHLGLPVLGLLLIHAHPRAREEWPFLLAALVAALLAFGRHLPAAREISPLLSLGGRVRFPVKWWYVVLLALVPLVARAAARYTEREARARRPLALALGLGAVGVLAWQWPATPLAALGPLASLALLLALVAFPRPRRSLGLLPGAVAASLLLCDLPLFLAFLDRPPDTPPRAATGRILARLDLQPHPVGPATHPHGTTRGFYRRASSELWPLISTVTGGGYAFDDDPDGAYADEDRALRKLLEEKPWPDRAAELRLAGVTHVLADEPVPYREAAVLNESEGVRLYAVDGGLPSVRFATRVHRRPSLESTVDLHGSTGFDPSRDVVLPGSGETTGTGASARVETLRETTDRLRVRVDAPEAGFLVWSRTFFSAWRARVDGAPAEALRADGHLVGVAVPAGAHTVEVSWSARPVIAGGVLAIVGLVAVALLRR